LLEREGVEQDIAEAAEALLSKAWTPEIRRAWMAERIFPMPTWYQGAEAGWLELMVDEADGGLGLGPVEACAVAETAGRHLLPGPLTETIVASTLIRGPAVRASFGRSISCLQGPADLRSGVLSASSLAGEWAANAALLVVDVREAIVGVDPNGRGVKVRKLDSLDAFRQACLVDLEGAEVALVLAEGPSAEAAGINLRNVALVMHASSLLGLAEAMLTMALNYARERRQFDRPISSFQAVQHRLAEMKVLVESLRSACYLAQVTVRDQPSGGATRAATVAKAHGSWVAREVAEGALQVHGGIGFTAEHDLSLYLLHSLTLQSALGDEQHLRRELGLKTLTRPTTVEVRR
jgi:alkylation response protein AidB-like acyl-CoA dehydrogenase